MPQARYRLVDTRTTPYYHCISRCVRRAFLCGFDSLSGKNFDHRKQWLLDRIKQLSGVFAIDVCAYAIMSNHFHLVLHVDTASAESWSDEEVLFRWLSLHKAPFVVQKYQTGEQLNSIEQEALSSTIDSWRSRLADLSWYMRCLNEFVARCANAEEKCTGRFWEGRFKSQALLDEAALFSCMAYVDLNPIRAGLSESLEDSEFTSIQERLRHFAAKSSRSPGNAWLSPLKNEIGCSGTSRIPLSQESYFSLVDWTGRAIREEKHGAIPAEISPILERLGVDQSNWVTNTRYFGNRFYRGVGRLNQLKRLAAITGQCWVQGKNQVDQFYASIDSSRPTNSG